MDKHVQTKHILNPTMEELLVQHALNGYNWHTFRINDSNITLEKMSGFAESINAPRWVVGHEISMKKVKHSHIVVGMTKSLTDYKLDNAIKSYFDIVKGHYSKSTVRTTMYRAIQYSIKDGDYKMDPRFPKDLIKNIYRESTKKFFREEFVDKLTQFEHLYYNGKISYKNFGKQYNDLRLQYGQKPNRNSQTSYLNYHLQKNDPEAADEWIYAIINEIKSNLIAY